MKWNCFRPFPESCGELKYPICNQIFVRIKEKKSIFKSRLTRFVFYSLGAPVRESSWKADLYHNNILSIIIFRNHINALIWPSSSKSPQIFVCSFLGYIGHLTRFDVEKFKLRWHVDVHQTSENGHNHFVFAFSQVFRQSIDRCTDSAGHCDSIFGIAHGVLKQ